MSFERRPRFPFGVPQTTAVIIIIINQLPDKIHLQPIVCQMGR